MNRLHDETGQCWCGGWHEVTDLNAMLAANPPATESATSTVTPRRCRRHRWTVTSREPGTSEGYCTSCGAPWRPELSRRGRTARNRGNAYEREVAKKLGVSRVGQYGGKEDVGRHSDWIVAQTKVGSYYPERIDGWLRALPANAAQLRAVVIGDAPGSGGRRRSLIVLDLTEFCQWFGRASQEDEAA